MGQPTEETSPQANAPSTGWDGKCQTCRKLMSRCMCFQGPEGDEASLKASTTTGDVNAAETRPLWNALRKMHRKSSTARLILHQPPMGDQAATREHRKRSEALPPLSAPSRHHHRRSSREPVAELSPERPSHSRRDRLQRAGITSSSPNVKKEAGAMRSVRSASSMDKQSSSRPKENFIYGSPIGGNSDEDNEETVWEL